MVKKHYPAPQPMPEDSAPLASQTPEQHVPAPDYLKSIRTRYMNARTDIAHTIGQLQAHRDEIDATIAFLKAHQK
jgi:hypothetical protein